MKQQSVGNKNKIEKPSVLYHASRNSNIEIFEPRNEKIRDLEEGSRVFATPSKAMASVFLVPTDDTWTQKGTFNDLTYIVISDEKRFKNLDVGGAIYLLPNETFENNPDKGLRELEWTSAKPVTPIKKEIVNSALDTMLKNGVQVYFVSTETFLKMRAASDHGESIIKSLIPEKNPFTEKW